VTDGSSFTERESDATTHTTRLADPKALVYQQVNTEKSGRWRITKTYVTDPRRATVMVDVDFRSLTGRPYQLYALYNPRLSNGASDKLDDSGRSAGDALLAHDAKTGSALVASPGFTETSSGYLGTSDGWQDLRTDHRQDAPRRFRGVADNALVVGDARRTTSATAGRTTSTSAPS
jgi:glucoamylase